MTLTRLGPALSGTPFFDPRDAAILGVFRRCQVKSNDGRQSEVGTNASARR